MSKLRIHGRIINFQQAAGLVNYYNTENWTALQVTYDEELGRILEYQRLAENFPDKTQQPFPLQNGDFASVWLQMPE
jgi:beta-xylosidase